MRSHVSIKDIAQAAGVSHSTVSRALKGTGRMAPATRERIRRIAQELGYTPSLVARSLVTQRTHTLGLVVTTIADPFHTEVVRGVEERAREAGYSLLLAMSNEDPQQEMQAVRSFQERRVDGVIVAASRVGARYGGLLCELGVPIVLINNHVEGANIHSVAHDDYNGARQVMAHLLALGYRRIAYLGNAHGGNAQARRQGGWRDALLEAGLPAPRTLCAEGPDGRVESGQIALERLLTQAARWPEAIFCYNDMMAIGVMHALKARGLRIPDDIALVGFDDIDLARYLDPALTTLAQPRYEMGRQAVEVLLALLDGSTKPRRRITLQGHLVVRASTASAAPLRAGTQPTGHALTCR